MSLRRSHRPWRYGDPSGSRATPRPGARVEPSRYQPAAWTSCLRTGGCRPGYGQKRGEKWIDLGLVFTTRYGTPLDAADVRRGFRAAIGRAPGIDADEWTPRELRHSFVSLLSDSGVPIEEISRLVGHRSTVVTEIVYRKQLRPVIQSGATVMDHLFAANKTELGGQVGGQEPLEAREPGSLAEGTGL